MAQVHIMWNTDLEPLIEHDVRVLKQARRLAIVNDINIVIKRKKCLFRSNFLNCIPQAGFPRRRA